MFDFKRWKRRLDRKRAIRDPMFAVAKPRKRKASAILCQPAQEKEPEKVYLRGLDAVRTAVTDYYANPQKYFDFSTVRPNSYWGGEAETEFVVNGKSLVEATGIQKLGSGHYSEVFAIDENTVVKIVKKKDKGYARFVKAIKDLDNPHFPKILACETWGGKTVYVLERLQPECENGDYDSFRAAIYAAGNPYIDFKDENIKSAAELLKAQNLASDIHGDNIMWRGNVPVITDPCSEGGTT